MASLSLFSHAGGSGPLHRLDPRLKLGALLITYGAIFLAGLLGQLPVVLLLAAALILARLPVRPLARSLRPFLLFLLFIFSVRLLTGSLCEALLMAVRLFLTLMASILFTATTGVREIRQAVVWCLRLIPGLPAERLGTMLSLTLSLIPLLFERAGRTMEALQARLACRRKNPLQRILYTASPLLISGIRLSGQMSMAMEARCYCERPKDISLQARARDWIACGISLLVFALALLLSLRI